MSQSTGIVLATGMITLGNTFVLADKQPDDPWNDAARIIVATAVTAGILAVIERPAPELAVALGWATFLAVTIIRVNPTVPSPSERLFTWWETARK